MKEELKAYDIGYKEGITKGLFFGGIIGISIGVIGMAILFILYAN